MVGDPCRSGDGFHQRGKIVGATGFFQKIFLFELMRKGDEIDRFIVVVKIDHRLKQMIMGLPIKIIAGQEVHNLVEGVVVDQDACQDGLFRFNVVRRDFDGWGNYFFF